jgi:hypothetical protein
MKLNTTRWSPDTCDCELEYTWDEDLPQEQRTTTISFVNKSCSNHRNLLPNSAVTYSCIIDENQKKNKTLSTALELAPNQLADIFTSPDNNIQYYILKKDIVFTFSFSGTAPNRILTVQFIGATLTQNQKNSIQNKLNQMFGTGNVVII